MQLFFSGKMEEGESRHAGEEGESTRDRGVSGVSGFMPRAGGRFFYRKGSMVGGMAACEGKGKVNRD